VFRLSEESRSGARDRFAPADEPAVKRRLPLLMAALLLTGLALSCGGSPQPSINSGKDRPKPAEKER
jgi:hypothetical protein